MKAANPVPAPNSSNTTCSPQHWLQGTDFTCHPSYLPSGMLSHPKDLTSRALSAESEIPQDWTSPFALTTSLKGILKAWLVLTCSTTSFFFAAILLQEWGSLEQPSQVQSTADVLQLHVSHCWGQPAPQKKLFTRLCSSTQDVPPTAAFLPSWRERD